MPQKRKLWTADDDAELARLADSGLPRDQIAQRLGRTIAAVEVRAATLGIKMISIPPKRRDPSANAAEPTTAAIDPESDPTAGPKRRRSRARR
jgi:hypothetical protein